MTTIQKAILAAALKGIVHATIIPVFIFLMVNIYFEGNWGGVAAVVYMLFAWIVYNILVKNKDISKMAFNWSAMAMVVVPLLSKIAQALAWGIAG